MIQTDITKHAICVELDTIRASARARAFGVYLLSLLFWMPILISWLVYGDIELVTFSLTLLVTTLPVAGFWLSDTLARRLPRVASLIVGILVFIMSVSLLLVVLYLGFGAWSTAPELVNLVRSTGDGFVTTYEFISTNLVLVAILPPAVVTMNVTIRSEFSRWKNRQFHQSTSGGMGIVSIWGRILSLGGIGEVGILRPVLGFMFLLVSVIASIFVVTALYWLYISLELLSSHVTLTLLEFSFIAENELFEFHSSYSSKADSSSAALWDIQHQAYRVWVGAIPNDYSLLKSLDHPLKDSASYALFGIILLGFGSLLFRLIKIVTRFSLIHFSPKKGNSIDVNSALVFADSRAAVSDRFGPRPIISTLIEILLGHRNSRARAVDTALDEFGYRNDVKVYYNTGEAFESESIRTIILKLCDTVPNDTEFRGLKDGDIVIWMTIRKSRKLSRSGRSVAFLQSTEGIYEFYCNAKYSGSGLIFLMRAAICGEWRELIEGRH